MSDIELMELIPEWNERISTDGSPQNPLRANTVRNSMTGDIVEGITTDVYPRGRYVSGFCWAIYKATNHPATGDWTIGEQKNLIKDIEEVMALATHRYQGNGHIYKGQRGLTGSSSLDNDVFGEDGVLDLDEFELLSSDYAVEVIQPNLRDFRLRRGELDLTGAGKELAEAVDAELGDMYPELVDRSQKGRVSAEFIDEISDRLSLQAVFDNERFGSERDKLQKVALGMLEWENNTVVLADWRSEIDICIDEHIEYTNLGKSHPDDIRDSFESKQHHLRRGWLLFILRTHQITENQTPPFRLDETDIEEFGGFIDVSRVYWLQVQTAHALRAQLYALCAYLRQEAPREVHQDRLFGRLERTDIASDVGATFEMSVNETEGDLTTGRTVRDLLLAGESSGSEYTWDVPEAGSVDAVEKVGDVRLKVDEMTENGWAPTTDRVTLQSIEHAIEDSLEKLSGANSTEEAEGAFGEVLSRTTVCLFLSAAHYRNLMQENEALETYIESVYGRYLSSVTQVTEFLESLGDETPIEEAAVSVLESKVIGTHERVLRDRLNNNSPLTMCFDFNPENSSFRTAGGVVSPGLQWLRLVRVSAFLRDAGLLVYESGGYRTTPTGEMVLERLRGER